MKHLLYWLNIMNVKIGKNDCMYIADIIVDMINYHYYDLQMYANFVISIDNTGPDRNKSLAEDDNTLKNFVLDRERISVTNNIETRIQNTIKTYFPLGNKIFTEENMQHLRQLINSNRLATYFKIVEHKHDAIFFKSGVVSSSILFKTLRDTPTIIKVFPLQIFHHYRFHTKEFIKTYIESPLCALFFKEAWMILFGKQKLSKYTPAFSCMIGCYISRGLPIRLTNNIKYKYINSVSVNPKNNKKWFEKVLQNDTNQMAALYGCFVMLEIEGTLGNLMVEIKSINKKIHNLSDVVGKKLMSNSTQRQLAITHHKLVNAQNKNMYAINVVKKVITNQVNIRKRKELIESLNVKKINLSFFFEYMYGKLVAAYIGKIIFTDDHFDNIAYVTVDYCRHYKIKCNGCDYHFYMPAGKMVQFIDLERYIFNYSRYDIYTNSALQNIPKSDFVNIKNNNWQKIKENYLRNEFIFDKGIFAFMDPRILIPESFADYDEYSIMINIFMDNFVYDIKTFCQIMSMYLPKKYMTMPKLCNIQNYYIDLDDDDIRIIDNNFMEKRYA